MRIFKGNIGIAFRIKLISEDSPEPIDVSGAGTLEIAFRKPDESEVIKTASLVTDGTDGLFEYVTVTDDLDQAGDWAIQPVITGLNGFTGRGSYSQFQVLENVGDI